MNLELYNRVREVPAEAKKTIRGGRLNGMTDINPMWRIKKLTEEFGPCGVGWYYVPTNKEVVKCDNGEVCVFVDIDLFTKSGDEWSQPIYGTGGSKLVAKEKGGLYVNDEAYKMATTDAISVACKSLGMGADVYWQNDNTKYNDTKRDQAPDDLAAEMERGEKTLISKSHMRNIETTAAKIGLNMSVILNQYGVQNLMMLTEAQYGDCMNRLAAEAAKKEERVIGAE